MLNRETLGMRVLEHNNNNNNNNDDDDDDNDSSRKLEPSGWTALWPHDHMFEAEARCSNSTSLQTISLRNHKQINPSIKTELF